MFGIFNRKCSLEESGLLHVIQDRHSHIMYGVDDGVKTYEESSDIFAWLSGNGLKSLWLTPHVMEDIPNSSESLSVRFSGMVQSLGHGAVLHLAAEYMMDNLFVQRLESGDLLCMEDNMVLMETSVWESPSNFTGMLEDTMRAGFWPVLAHPERYRYMDMADYGRLREMGVRLQLNLPSMIGMYGEHVQKKARGMLYEGMYSFVGSDCHNFNMYRKLYTAKELKKKDVELIAALCRHGADAAADNRI